MSRLHSKDLSGPCAVYVMVNPRTRNPFYIGISKWPWERFYQHKSDRCSAAWADLNMWLGLFPADRVFKIYKWCKSRQEALDLEYRLVCSTPNLLNRDQRKYVMYRYREAA